MIHPKDRNANNPRLKCIVCGKWMRMTGKDENGERIQRFYGGCNYSHGDHLSGKKGTISGAKGNGDFDVCQSCCDSECKRISGLAAPLPV